MSRQLRTSMEMLMDSIAATERDQSRPFHLIRGDAERVSEELSTLRADNARLREALQSIADYDRDITGGPQMVLIASAALSEVRHD